MKIFICLSLLIAATATCDNLAGSESGESATVVQNNVTPPEYLKVNQETYKTYAAPVLPIVYKTPATKPQERKLAHFAPAHEVRKPVAVKAPPPVPVKRVFEEVPPVAHKTQTYSVPKSVVQGYSTQGVRTLKEDEHPVSYGKEYIDPETESVDYQPEEYPAVPTGVQYVPPPVLVYNPYPPVVRRGYRLPAYRRPSYARLFNVEPPAYRSVGYGSPLPYPIRNFAYGYPPPSVRYAYVTPNVAYDNGVAPVNYNGFIEAEYDEFLKKK